MKNLPTHQLLTSGKPRPGAGAGAGANAPAAACGYNAYAAQCPTRFALDRIADKWSVLVLGALARAPRRFNTLQREVEGISQKVLSQTLKRLTRDGLVVRRAFATVPVTVEYAVTPLGITLADCVTVVIAWAEDNIEAVLCAQRAYDAAGAGAGADADGVAHAS